MKYSVRGTLNMSDGASVIALLNTFELWRLETKQSVNEEEQDIFTFEVWVNTAQEKTHLFEQLKPFVDVYGEMIDWHECTHDEAVSLPCAIAETYQGGE